MIGADTDFVDQVYRTALENDVRASQLPFPTLDPHPILPIISFTEPVLPQLTLPPLHHQTYGQAAPVPTSSSTSETSPHEGRPNCPIVGGKYFRIFGTNIY